MHTSTAIWVGAAMSTREATYPAHDKAVGRGPKLGEAHGQVVVDGRTGTIVVSLLRVLLRGLIPPNREPQRQVVCARSPAQPNSRIMPGLSTVTLGFSLVRVPSGVSVCPSSWVRQPLAGEEIGDEGGSVRAGAGR